MRRTTVLPRRSRRTAATLAALALLAPAAGLVAAPAASAGAVPAASAGAVPAASTGAVPAAPAADTAVTTFGIRPGTRKGPDPRRTFVTVTAAPGTTVTDTVYVSNLSAEPLTLAVYASDAYNNPDGGYNVLLQDKPSQDLGSWVRLGARTVAVPGGKGVLVPFRIAVPGNAATGDHAAGIVVSLRRPQIVKGTRVLVEQRVGVRVYLRVPGDLKPALAIENFSVRYSGTYNPVGGDVTVEYDVRNSGNVRLSASQSALVAVPLLGTRSGQVSGLRDLLPGGRAHVSVAFGDVPPLGPLDTRVSVDPIASAGAPDPGLPSVVRSATPWGVFWLALLAVVALAALAWFVVRRRRRTPAVAAPPVERAPVTVP